MNVAMLGTGVVGQALAKGFRGRGDAVTFGTRDPHSTAARDAVAAVHGTRAARHAEAVDGADVIVLATAWTGAVAALDLAGPERFEGRVVIDATNPLDTSSGAPRLALGHSTSGGETVQRHLPRARVVKAFNTVTAAHMVHPRLPDGTPDMFIAGDDADAKRTVGAILRDFGWPSIDVGGIEAARLLEPLAMLWITYGLVSGHWSHAFKLLGKADA